MDQCSPLSNLQNKNETTIGTCYNYDQLKMIAESYNAAFSNKIPITNNMSILLKSLKTVLDPICKTQSAWLDQTWINPILKKGKKLIFRAEHPTDWLKNPNEWLTNIDIHNSLIQYQDAYPTFKFMGVFPIDFATKIDNGKCIRNELCILNIVDLTKQGITQIGAIFNLDRHDQPGSHWVGMYANWNKSNPNYGVFYYDSNGLRTPRQIDTFMNQIVQQVHKLEGKESSTFQSYMNKKRHQLGNTECGMFSQFFLIWCLKGYLFKDITKSKYFRDETMLSLRKKLYRSPVVSGSRSESESSFLIQGGTTQKSKQTKTKDKTKEIKKQKDKDKEIKIKR
jgi:hypothetical protein